jgi:hypothetical protein
MVITEPNQIATYRLLTLRAGLRLELRGLKVSKGRSCYAIIKQEFGFKGDKASVLEQFENYLSAHDPFIRKAT